MYEFSSDFFFGSIYDVTAPISLSPYPLLNLKQYGCSYGFDIHRSSSINHTTPMVTNPSRLMPRKLPDVRQTTNDDRVH